MVLPFAISKRMSVTYAAMVGASPNVLVRSVVANGSYVKRNSKTNLVVMDWFTEQILIR